MALHAPRRYTADTMFREAREAKNYPIRLHGKVAESIVDGPGLRYVIFVQGCPHGCAGCHNPDSHDPNGGTLSSTSALIDELRRVPQHDGVTFSGGEPFLWGRELYEIGQAAHKLGMNVMTYSGYTWEVLREKARSDEGVRQLLIVTDILVDGPFVESKRDITLRYRGSSNQRILDLGCYPNSEAVSERFDLY